ncbi:unnamed protein product [Didymodactylos carnosus]|uniref:Uncharacterized protein n=1 Tax=Didymodactylos carnosus TaxID=1234261 RepID=A0A815Y7T7_9BILA|nr:unnamed protein product [Didymodactylos carnosus]CAF1566424.1 unnamed protein product [Didymodactylos carnosus]CAF4060423.1 unnamed protein product [Didymodactylos carnosus]CAF4428719.1 unnamed protein product [Didymodactylos carnosus]
MLLFFAFSDTLARKTSANETDDNDDDDDDKEQVLNCILLFHFMIIICPSSGQFGDAGKEKKGEKDTAGYDEDDEIRKN